MRWTLSIALAAALGLSGCATTGGAGTTDTTAVPQASGTTSNPVTGAAAASTAGSRAIGAYGAIGTSDDVRGRTSSASASQFNGRAALAGADSGTDDDAPATDTDDPPRR